MVGRGRRQPSHLHRHQALAEIAVRVQGRGRLAADRGIGGIDGVGDQGGGDVGFGGARRQRRHRIGDAERQATPAPPAGGQAAHARCGFNPGEPVEGRRRAEGHDAGCEGLAGGQEQGDVTAIVDVGLVQAAALHQRRQDLVGNGPGHRRHGRDENPMVGHGGPRHAPRHRPRDGGTGGADRGTEVHQLTGQFAEDRPEPRPRLLVGAGDLAAIPEGLDHQVDGAVLEMMAPPVAEDGADRRRADGADGIGAAHRLAAAPGSGAPGHGARSCQRIALRRSAPATSSRRLIESMWPPMAA